MINLLHRSWRLYMSELSFFCLNSTTNRSFKTRPKKKITSSNFIIEFSEKATKNLNNRVVEIAYGDEVITHYIDKIDYRIYQIEANFETILSKEGEYLA